MPAGVHGAGRRRERLAALLGERQRIHVAAEQHGRQGDPPPPPPRSTATTEVQPRPGVISRSRPASASRNSGLGAGKLQPELGALMQRAAEPAQAWPEGGCLSRGQLL